MFQNCVAEVRCSLPDTSDMLVGFNANIVVAETGQTEDADSCLPF